MNGYFTRGFFISLVVSFLFLVGFLFAVSYRTYVTASLEEANQTYNYIEQQRASATLQSILINNLMVSLPLLIPMVGLVPFLYVWYNTGTVIGLLSLAYHIPPTIYVLELTVLAFPEFLSYTFLFAENLYVSYLALTRSSPKQRIVKHSWKSIIIYIFLLALSAGLEAAMIG